MIRRLLASRLFWLLAVPCSLLACTSMLPTFESDFDGDEVVSRQTLEVVTPTRTYGLSYLRAGNPNAQRVIFVHGTPGDGGGWLGYLRSEPSEFEFLAIDRPGFGRTTPKQEVTSLDEQAAMLEPLLVQRNGRWPILVGHSLGGPVVAAAAANYPDRVAGVVELAASLDPSLEEILWIQYLGETPPIVWLLPPALKHTNREIFALEDELIALGDKLDKVRCPVVIVHGTEDDLVPYENVYYMRETFSGAATLDVVELVGKNHFLPWNSESEVRAAIDALARPAPYQAAQDAQAQAGSRPHKK